MLPQNTVEILKSLNKSELKKLGDFIRSPYFNSRETLHLLFLEIDKQYPELTDKKFEYKRIYKKIYPGEYKESTVRNLYSDFGGLLKKFIAYEKFGSNEMHFNLELVNGLWDKKCFEQSNKIISSLKKEMESTISFERGRFLNMLALEMCYSNNLNGMNKRAPEEYNAAFNSLLDNLTYFFLWTGFDFQCLDSVLEKAHNIKDKKVFINKEFLKNIDMENFIKTLPQGSYSDAMKIIYLLYKYTGSDISGEQYTEFIKLIKNNFDNFDTITKFTVWNTLLTIILLKLVPKDNKYYSEAFELNKYFENFILVNNPDIHLAAPWYRNVISIALVVKEYDWAKKFIDNYSGHLREEIRDKEINYAMGRLSCQLKEHEKSLQYLNKIKFEQITERLNVNFYYLVNYIELKSYQPAISMLNSIRQFYSESKEISEMFAVLIEDSLKYFKEIIKAEENNKKIDYAILKEAENAGRYYQKQYILEKLKQLVN